ncbi:MAG: hypothetical protein AVDCRST_MAG48-820, partial [uncultured Friedmanniella sp.]
GGRRSRGGRARCGRADDLRPLAGLPVGHRRLPGGPDARDRRARRRPGRQRRALDAGLGRRAPGWARSGRECGKSV